MVCHILCPECSEDLSEIYSFYKLIKNIYCENLLKTKETIDLSKIDFKVDILKDFEFILEAVNIKNHCCIIHIIGETDFDTLFD
jgi:hypothetical protein